MAKSVIWHNFQSSSNKQARHTLIVVFQTAILFNHPNVNMFFFFVCLSDCNYLSFPCVSDTLARDFLSALFIYRRKVELCHPLYDFHGKESKWLFVDIAMFLRQNPESLTMRKYHIIWYAADSLEASCPRHLTCYSMWLQYVILSWRVLQILGLSWEQLVPYLLIFVCQTHKLLYPRLHYRGWSSLQQMVAKQWFLPTELLFGGVVLWVFPTNN